MAQGTHVGALGTAHPYDELVRGGLGLHGQSVDGDGAGGALHLAAFAGQFVELFSVDFDGGKHGRDLGNIPAELFQYGFQLRRGDLYRLLLQYFARGVLRIGHKAQLQPSHIFLFALVGKFHRAGGPAHKDGQYSGGHGVQRSGMTDALFLQDATQLGAYVHGGPLLWFVNDNDTVRHKRSSLSFVLHLTDGGQDGLLSLLRGAVHGSTGGCGVTAAT